MNHCDHDHETRDTIRRLPIGGGAAVLLCHKHYEVEMAFRRMRTKQTGTDKWEFPAWASLEVLSASIEPAP